MRKNNFKRKKTMRKKNNFKRKKTMRKKNILKRNKTIQKKNILKRYTGGKPVSWDPTTQIRVLSEEEVKVCQRYLNEKGVEVSLIEKPIRKDESGKDYRVYVFKVGLKGMVDGVTFERRFSKAQEDNRRMLETGIITSELAARFPYSKPIWNMVTDEANVQRRGEELQGYYTAVLAQPAVLSHPSLRKILGFDFGVLCNKFLSHPDANPPPHPSAYFHAAEPAALKVKQLKDLLTKRGVNIERGLELSDLVALEANTRSKPAPPPAADQTEEDLFSASKTGNVDAVKKLLEVRGLDVNQSNKDKITPLWFASQNGHAEVVDLLVKSGAEVNLPNKDKITPLWIASYQGHAEVVEALIMCEQPTDAADLDVNLANEVNITPLWIASQNGHAEVVDLLVESGAKVNLPNKDEITPLWIASYQGHAEVVDRLVEAGADVNKGDKKQRTPLDIARQYGHADVEDLLVKAGAHANQPSASNAPELQPLFDVLGVDESANFADIKKAYRKRALHLHPDKNLSDQEASAEKFKAISEAYNVLSDHTKRAEYIQRFRESQAAQGQGAAYTGTHSARWEHAAPAPAKAPAPAPASGGKLPPGWKEKTSRSTGETYYINKKMNISVWDRPVWRPASARTLPPYWIELISREGDIYYYNTVMKDSVPAPAPSQAKAQSAPAMNEYGCMEGWAGANCDKCAPGWGGQDCDVPPGWREEEDEGTGIIYYTNEDMQKTTFDPSMADRDVQNLCKASTQAGPEGQYISHITLPSEVKDGGPFIYVGPDKNIYFLIAPNPIPKKRNIIAYFPEDFRRIVSWDKILSYVPFGYPTPTEVMADTSAYVKPVTTRKM